MPTQEAQLAALISALGTDYKTIMAALAIRQQDHNFSASGALSVRTGKSFIKLKGSGLIVGVDGWLDTPATGATTFKVDVNLNGTTIFGTQANRPIWAASANAPTVGAFSVTTYADGDRLSCDIDAVGSTVPGSDLTMSIFTLRTA